MLQERYKIPIEGMTGADFVEALAQKARAAASAKPHPPPLPAAPQLRQPPPLPAGDSSPPPNHALPPAPQVCAGDSERAGRKILKDYQNGALGVFCLEQPPRPGEGAPGSKEKDYRLTRVPLNTNK